MEDDLPLGLLAVGQADLIHRQLDDMSLKNGLTAHGCLGQLHGGLLLLAPQTGDTQSV